MGCPLDRLAGGLGSDPARLRARAVGSHPGHLAGVWVGGLVDDGWFGVCVNAPMCLLEAGHVVQ